jgi:hypothetical protein
MMPIFIFDAHIIKEQVHKHGFPASHAPKNVGTFDFALKRPKTT